MLYLSKKRGGSINVKVDFRANDSVIIQLQEDQLIKKQTA